LKNNIFLNSGAPEVIKVDTWKYSYLLPKKNIPRQYRVHGAKPEQLPGNQHRAQRK